MEGQDSRFDTKSNGNEVKKIKIIEQEIEAETKSKFDFFLNFKN